MVAICSISGCEKPRRSRTWCDKHYQRWYTTGTTDLLRPSLEERTWSKIDKHGPDGCWLWNGPRSRAGYGILKVEGHQRPAHRIVYELMVGPIPEELQLDHLCRVVNCMNPDHLEPVTRKENSRRGLNGVMKTHCVNGHPYTPENVRNSGGKRRCKICHRERERRRRGISPDNYRIK